jgi:phosphatidylinositol alpha 1,6-mannosyltransferase
MRAEPRVAFFTDSYLEVNGVAQTSRQFAAFAKRRGLPMLCVHAGPRTETAVDGSVTRLALKRTSVGFRIESDQRFDLLMWRHTKLVLEKLREFNPDLIHITGPSDIGQLGAYVASKLRLPVVISWHTNLHEYAGRRLNGIIPFLPGFARAALVKFAERQSLRVLLKFYKIGRVILAPNEELGELLKRGCGKPVFLMRRGVDTSIFSPAKRDRRDGVFTLGYVGRLTPEKNVRFLAELEKELLASGRNDFRFLIVGTGSELGWLEQNMRRAEFTGVLKDEALARAYANLDLFIFPSQTDTFGNVVLEAQASGIPAIVSADGGPKFIIRNGTTGYIAGDRRSFFTATIDLMSQSEKLVKMREEARELARGESWDNIFEQVLRAYDFSLQQAAVTREPAARVPASMASPEEI